MRVGSRQQNHKLHLAEMKDDRMFVYHDRISGQGIAHGLWSQSLLTKSHMEEMLVSRPHILKLCLFFWGSLDVSTFALATEGTDVLGGNPEQAESDNK